jgi:hypothetical protein
VLGVGGDGDERLGGAKSAICAGIVKTNNRAPAAGQLGARRTDEVIE